MCGRFSLFTNEEILKDEYSLDSIPKLSEKYNIAPGQNLPIILFDEELNRNTLFLAHWGFIPSWVKEIKEVTKPINARYETLEEKPYFRSSFSRQRCLIPANGFFEWDKRTKPGTPFHFHLENNKLFSFAGLWSKWKGNNEETIISCTLITTNANSLISPIHDRMPVILQKENYKKWLNPDSQIKEIKYMLESRIINGLEAHEVSRVVNSPSNDSADCIKPI